MIVYTITGFGLCYYFIDLCWRIRLIREIMNQLSM